MESAWLAQFTHDPLPPLLATGNLYLEYFVQRDLLDQPVDSIEELWALPAAEKILRKQLPDGSWPDKAKSRHSDPVTNYNLLETFRALGFLVELFGFTSAHPAIQAAAEYVFTTQAPEGDFRGIYGTQYSPNYTACILEFLVKAGYAGDQRVEKCFKWLLAMRQDDGAWAWPLFTLGMKMYDFDTVMRDPTPHEPDRAQPFSHGMTGIVIRAFAAHPERRFSAEVRAAADLLVTRFFKPDKSSSRQHQSNWTKYSFPPWWFDLISILNALSLMHYPRANGYVQRALHYYQTTQRPEGTWDFYVLQNKNLPDKPAWLALVLCRAFKRFYG